MKRTLPVIVMLAAAALSLAACNRKPTLLDRVSTGQPFGAITGDAWATSASMGVWIDPRTGCGYVVASITAQASISVTPELGADGKPICEVSKAAR